MPVAGERPQVNRRELVDSFGSIAHHRNCEVPSLEVGLPWRCRVVKPPLRTKTLGTKVSEEEFAQLEAANNEDVPVGMDIWHNSKQCPNCADTWRNASGAGNTAFVATGAVLVGVPLTGEAAGAIAACKPGLNTSNYGQITVYCRAWMPGNLIGIGYDPKNGLHVNVGNSVHIPLWPWP